MVPRYLSISQGEVLVGASRRQFTLGAFHFRDKYIQQASEDINELLIHYSYIST